MRRACFFLRLLRVFAAGVQFIGQNTKRRQRANADDGCKGYQKTPFLTDNAENKVGVGGNHSAKPSAAYADSGKTAARGGGHGSGLLIS